jgi:hypothetical protein
MKPQHIYLDTNAFRYFGIAFENVPLATDLRDKILISPLSAFEVLAQLADDDEAEANRGLLPWPDDMLHYFWFQKPLEDDGFTKKMEQSFNVCLTADSLIPLKEAAEEQKKAMDDFKLSTAHNFKNMLDDLRNQQGKVGKKARPVDLTEVWFRGIANRVQADPKSRKISDIQSVLSAYHEFEQSKLQTALMIPEYQPMSRKNQNDIIDAEQLVYLGDPSLCMLTADKGFKSKVAKSEQASRIIVAASGDLMDAQKAEAVMRVHLSR